MVEQLKEALESSTEWLGRAAVTEQWGSTYVQLLVVLAIFGFGIPAFAQQLTLQDDIRLVAIKHLNPWPLRAVNGTLALLIVAFIAGPWHATSGAPISDPFHVLLILVAMIVVPCFAGAIWYRWVLHHRRDVLLRAVSSSLIRQRRARRRHSHRSLAVFQNTKDNLALLCSGAASRAERERAVEALDSVIASIQSMDDYTAVELDVFISSLGTLARSSVSEPAVCERALTALIAAEGRISGDANYSDRGRIAVELRSLCAHSLSSRSDALAFQCVDAVAARSPRDLLPLGRVAMESNRWLAIAYILSKARQRSDGPTDELLGLVGLLVKTGSASARALTQQALDLAELDPSRVVTAVRRLQARCEFEAADALAIAHSDSLARMHSVNDG